jgi:hypothetical protein
MEGADIRLVLVVGRDDRDGDALVSRLELLDRHVGRHHRTLAGEIGVEAATIVEDADLERCLRGGRPRSGRESGKCRCQEPVPEHT